MKHAAGWLSDVSGWCRDLLRLIFPLTCEVCGEALVDGERVLCLGCLAAMPGVYTGADSMLSRRLAAAVKAERVTAMFAYRRDTSYARVIQKSKYNGRPDIDYNLAAEFAAKLKPTGFFAGIDLLVPVPMHSRKKILRGFNQAEEIARGISENVGISVADNLVATRADASQTRRSALDRIKNTHGRYEVVYPEELRGKHLLLVDDVITTGATVMACCDALRHAVPDLKISILALAATRLE